MIAALRTQDARARDAAGAGGGGGGGEVVNAAKAVKATKAAKAKAKAAPLPRAPRSRGCRARRAPVPGTHTGGVKTRHDQTSLVVLHAAGRPSDMQKVRAAWVDVRSCYSMRRARPPARSSDGRAACWRLLRVAAARPSRGQRQGHESARARACDSKKLTKPLRSKLSG